jgi:hypothetical protein
MLTDWLEWAIHPVQHGKIDHGTPASQNAANPEYEALLACYRSEQMSTAQLLAHMDEDAAFESFVRARVNDRASPEKSEQKRVLVHH